MGEGPCRAARRDSLHLVGDPVDVVTGANTDCNLDFRLPGPVLLQWRRHYDSSKHRQAFGLGWGHAHEYERSLRFDMDGISYLGPLDRRTSFPPLRSDGETSSAGGLTLRRLSPSRFLVTETDQPTMEFEFIGNEPRTPLKQLIHAGQFMTFRYSPRGHLEEILDSRSRRIRAATDDAGRLLELILVGGGDRPDRPLVTYRYDPAGNLTEGIDFYRHRFTFAFDSANRMIRRTDRRGYSFLFDYDDKGRCISSRGEDGVFGVTLRYLPAEFVTIVTHADEGQWTYLYDPDGTIARIIDPYGGTRSFQRDQLGRISLETDGGGAVTRWLYAPDGKLLGTLSPRGAFHPDAKDQLGAAPGSHEVASCPLEWELGKLVDRHRISPPSAHDPALLRVPQVARHLLWTSDHGSGDTSTGPRPRPAPRSPRTPPPGPEYDELGLLLRQRWPDGTSRRWTYDPNGNVHRLIDREGASYTYEYASWNHLVCQTDPLGNSITYADTLAEKLARLTDAGGSVSEYGYDLKDRLTEVRRDGAVRERYRYDVADNLVEKVDGTGRALLSFEVGSANLPTAIQLASGDVHTFEYDPQGRIVAAAAGDQRVTFAYDGLGRRVVDTRDDQGVQHRFTARGRNETVLFDRYRIRHHRVLDGTMHGPLVVRDPTGATHTVRLLGAGIVARAMSNGSSEVSQYDSSGRCLVRVTSRTGTAPWRRVYSYSAEGNLLESRDSEFGTFSFAYDEAHRLTRMTRPDGRTEEFSHDRAGNLVAQPGLSAVTLASGNRLVEANGARFEYDERHHVSRRYTRSEELRYVYDSRDMLVETVGGPGEWKATYDPLGRRTSKRVDATRTEFYWDTDRLAAELRDDRLRIYVYADSFALVPLLFVEYDGLESDPRSGRRYFIYCNQIGAPILVEDDTGAVVWRAWLDPYGVAHVHPRSSIDMSLRFPGHYFDAELGLHYNRFRYYDPRLGRYIQSDPIGVAGGANLYAYTAGDPLTQVDVRGLACPPERRVWSEEELAAAKEDIENRLGPAPLWQLKEWGTRPVTLTPEQAALHAALADPRNQAGGMLAYPYSRIPLEGSINAADLHAITAHTGLEHGVARDANGRVWITRGDPNGPGVSNDEECLVHTHPHDTPPSPNDLKLAPSQGGAVVGPDGRVTDFDSNGQNPHATQSPVAQDGTIDGNHHPIDPIVSTEGE